jgi:hypothetical protein
MKAAGESSQHIFGLTNESSWEIIPACSVTDSNAVIPEVFLFQC